MTQMKEGFFVTKIERCPSSFYSGNEMQCADDCKICGGDVFVKTEVPLATAIIELFDSCGYIKQPEWIECLRRREKK